MKAKYTKNETITITGITRDMFIVMSTIMNTANNRCFEDQNEDGDYYSNDDFVVSLTEDQRELLRDICKVI